MTLNERTGPTIRRRWLPMIDADACSGCGMCVEVCEHGCLDMVWSFATLLRPHDCGSEGHCVEACPEDVIAMGWVAVREAAVTEEDGRTSVASGADASPLAGRLLTEMLASIRHSTSTPLYFGIDSVQIVAAALRKVDPSGEEPRRLCADFERIARSALGCPPPVDRGSDDDIRPPETLPTLAAWFEERHRTMGAVHPLAMDVLGLLIEGESIREVAERLDLGLRLTRRIVRDAGAAWTEGPGSCSSR